MLYFTPIYTIAVRGHYRFVTDFGSCHDDNILILDFFFSYKRTLSRGFQVLIDNLYSFYNVSNRILDNYYYFNTGNKYFTSLFEKEAF